MGRVGKTFRTFGSKVKSLQRAKATVQLAVRDNASRVMDRVRGTWNSFRSHPVTRLTITAVDRARRILSGIKNTILSIPTMITIGLSYVGIKNLSEATVGAAMNWEQYEVSMEHWLDGNTKKAKELTKWMGEFADITPFSSPELFPALTRAVAISDKDLTKSKRLLAIASDMAALTPDRSVEDAMQAIANAKMGNTVMLEGFGLDISKKQMDSMGGWDKLLDKLAKDFKGGAEKLSKTAAGVLATLKGYRGSFMRSIGTGFLEPMKPRLDSINQWLSENQDTWGRWKDAAKNGGEVFSEWSFSNLEKGFDYLNNLFFPKNDGKEIKGPKYTGLLEGMNGDNPYTTQLKSMLGDATLEPQELTIKAKFKILYDDISGVISKWWDESGSDMAVSVGKSIGEGIIEGVKLTMKGGLDLLTGSYKDLYSNFMDHGFSKETGKSALGAAATTAGALYMGKKFLYNPARSVVRGGKNVVDTGRNVNRRWSAGSGRRQDKWNQSNDRRIQKGLARGDRAKEKRAARNVARQNGKGAWNEKNWTGPARQSAPYPKWLQKQIEKSSAPKFMSGGGAAKGIMKGVGGKIPLLSLAFGAMDATNGWKNAGNIMGKTTDELTYLDRASSSAANVLEGLTLGLIKAEKTVDFFTGGKTAERRNALMNEGSESVFDPSNPDRNRRNTRLNTEGTHLDAPLWVPNLGLDEGGAGMDSGLSAINQHAQQLAATLSAMEAQAQGALHNFTSLTMVTGEASGWITGAFHPLQGATDGLTHNISALTMVTGEAAGWLTGSFFPLQGATEGLTHNISALTMVTGEASGWITGAFYPLQESTGGLTQNISALTMTLGESSGWVTSSFYPLANGTLAQNANALAMTLGESSVVVASTFVSVSASGAVLTQNTNALAMTLGMTSGLVVSSFSPLAGAGAAAAQNAYSLASSLGAAVGWVSSLNGIQSGAAAVKSALSNLASRIASVPTPSVSVAGAGRGPGGPQVAYARGGIATSPHVGLVAEAGVPEAMIPWDGSSRSKALWQQTGEALGMFDGSTFGGGGGTDAAPAMVAASGGGGATFNFGDFHIGEASSLSADEVLNLIMPELYEKIKSAIAKKG